MPYITSIEQLGFKRGLQQGIQRGLQQLQSVILTLLTTKFGELPEDVQTTIQSINVPETLSQLSLRAATSPSLQGFMQFFDNY